MASSFATSVEVLQARATDAPEALAFEAAGEPITYGRLAAEARHLAAVLVQRGIGPDDRVALQLPTGLAFLRALFAVHMTGAASVALNTELPAPRIAHLMGVAGCTTMLDEQQVTEALSTPAPRAQLPRLSPEQPAVLQLTSGTTGESRAAVILHRNLVNCAESMNEHIGVFAGDVYVSWLPLYHDFGIVRFIFSPLCARQPSYLLPPSVRSFKPWLETIGRVRGTITGGPDFAYRIAARTVEPATVNLRSLRWASSGAEPVRAATVAEFESRFAAPGVIRPAYGLAEATLGVSSMGQGEPLAVDGAGRVCCGGPFPRVEMWVAGDDGTRLPAGVPGEVIVRGPMVFAGYHGDAAATRAVLRDDGLHTGDVGILDEQGRLYFVARKRALIKRAGAVIAPRDIEDAADRVPAVRLAAAIGRVRATDGTEEIVVVVEVRPEDCAQRSVGVAIVSAIENEVGKALGFAPNEVVLVPPRTIPRTPNGKIRYDALRDLLAGDLTRTALFSSTQT